MPISEARQSLTLLANDVSLHDSIIVTQRGRPSLAILPYDLFDSMVETLDILSDQELMKALRRGIQDVQDGKSLDWESVRGTL
jgi:prevent-host-death family protein